MKISGLDQLARKMTELRQATAELNGEVAQASFDPDDPASIELAIEHVGGAIDEKLAAYAHNDLVMSIASQFKENARAAILERAAAARLKRGREL